MIKLGIIARSDYSGLAYQTLALTKLLKPKKVLLIDSTPFNGREQHPDWFKNFTMTNGFATDEEVKEFIKDLDVVLTCEVPYNDNLYKICREVGVKTILQPNAELNPHILNRSLDLPDIFVLPSPWLEAETREIGIPTYVIKPPIIEPRAIQNIAKEKGKLRVLHFGGRRAAADRNGTEIVRALPKIEGIQIDIHDQGANEVQDQRELYEQGYHVILIPRRYGGLCLPMLESLSYGLPVIMPNIEPNRQELPQEWLTTAIRGPSIKTKHRIETYNADQYGIVQTLERFRDMTQEEYEAERSKAFELTEAHKEQLEQWIRTIESIVV